MFRPIPEAAFFRRVPFRFIASILLLFAVGIIASVFIGWLTLAVNPWASAAFQRQLFRIAETQATAGIQERAFVSTFGRIVLYVEEVSPSQFALKGLLASDERAAAGLMLQKLPGDAGDDDGAQRLLRRAESLARESAALGTLTIVLELLHGSAALIFATFPLLTMVIAAALGISPHTVVSHIKNTYRKLDVHNAAAAVMRAMQLGVFEKAEAGRSVPDPVFST